MKHEAKQYHFFKRKADNKFIGKVVEINEGDSIDNYIEVEFPEPIRKMIDKFKSFKDAKKE